MNYDCNRCQDRAVVGGFLPSPCPECRADSSSDNLRRERDEALARAASAESLAAERYIAMEELHAAIGEPHQQAPSMVERVRQEERERIATMVAKLTAAERVVEALRLSGEERWLLGLIPGVLESTFQRAQIEAVVNGTAEPVRANTDKVIAVLDRIIVALDAATPRTGGEE